MKRVVWGLLAGVFVLYVGAVVLLGFSGIVALSVHFGRVMLAVAVLILFVPGLRIVFREVPAPRRDYLLAGIILTWLSAVCFALWNEAGRQGWVETSIFLSPVAGFFSLLLVVGAAFHLAAPNTNYSKTRIIALASGFVVAVLVVLIGPLFR